MERRFDVSERGEELAWARHDISALYLSEICHNSSIQKMHQHCRQPKTRYPYSDNLKPRSYVFAAK